MNEVKYIIVIPPNMTIESSRAILFNGLFTHLHIYESCPPGSMIHSAGFCYFGPTLASVKCYGSSSSLGVDSDPEFDQEMILRTLGGLPINEYEQGF